VTVVVGVDFALLVSISLRAMRCGIIIRAGQATGEAVVGLEAGAVLLFGDEHVPEGREREGGGGE
jgi:hypothetical protein